MVLSALGQLIRQSIPSLFFRGVKRMKIRMVFVAYFVAFLQFFEIFQWLKIQNAM